MARDDKELTVILEDFKKHAETDLGIPFPTELISECLHALAKDRIREALKRRLNYLRDPDLLNLLRIFMEQQKSTTLKKAK